MKKNKIDLTKGDTYKRDAKLTESDLNKRIEAHEEMIKLNIKGVYGNRPDLYATCEMQIMRYKNELNRRKSK